MTPNETGYQYEAVFANSAGSATTSAATLTVSLPGTPQVVITNPASQTVKPGASVLFTVAASESPAPLVQWKLSTNGGQTFTPIRGRNINRVEAEEGSRPAER